MALVECAHAFLRHGEDLVIGGLHFRRSIGKIAEEREVQIGPAIGQELDLEILDCMAHVVDRAEQRRHHHRRSILWRHAMFMQIKTR